MLILAIETSCDETAAAVLRDGATILSDVVASQVAMHAPYGGVVPELASRMHVEVIVPVISRALLDAGIAKEDIDAIAVTQGPGLAGALLIGISAAKAMALALGKPLIAVNHLEGHIQAAFLGKAPPENPFVCLVVSGGHTALYRVEPDGSSRLLGSTRDDAAGEAFDKVAKLLGIGYPGGAAIDRLAAEGNPETFRFPRAYFGKDSLEFSFSGLKTAVANFVRRSGPPPSEGAPGPYRLEDLAASFQEAVIEVLGAKTFLAAELNGLADVAVVGGVAANSRLRRKLAEEAQRRSVRLHLPEIRFCTDNAVMIGAAAHRLWKRSGFTEDMLAVDARARWT